jgi:hypothetical protein
MGTVVVVGDREDRRLVSMTVDTLAASGIRAVESIDQAPPFIDAACILWQHGYSYRDSSAYADQCRAALGRARRGLVISFDGSTLPSDLADVPITYVPLPRGGFESTGTDVAAWQRLIRSIVPDLLFDTTDLRGAVSEAAGTLRMWLNRGSLPDPDRWPSWTTVRGILYLALAVAFYVAGLGLLEAVWPNRAAVLLGTVYTAALLITAGALGPFLIDAVERRLPFGWDLDELSPWVALTALPFWGLYGVHALLNRSWFPLGPLFMLVLGFAATALAFTVVHHLSIRGLVRLAADGPISFRACYICYPASLTALACLLETEFAIQGIRFFDSWAVREPSGRKRSTRSTRRQIKKAMRNSCVLVTVTSSEHLASPFTQYERLTAKSLKRPVLDVHATDQPFVNDGVAWDTISLPEYLRHVLHDMRTPPTDGGVGPLALPPRELLADLYGFIGRICPVCHGHGRDARFAWRMIPYAFRIRCPHCRGTAKGLESAFAVRLFRARA